MKNLVIMGSTGSIGTQTLDVVRNQSDFKVCGLSANRDVDKMEAQVREFHPRAVCMMDEKAAEELKSRIPDTDTDIYSGMEGMIELATLPESSMLVMAVVGMIALKPTIAAIQAKKDIALSNKEVLVTAGHLIIPMAKRGGVRIFPVDSEHSAIFQCLQAGSGKEVKRILLTASGGPFRGKKREELMNVTVEDALKHPNWSMGRKITIDSATMVNKGLEVMEAGWLFGVRKSQIEVLVHPQSILHSAVEYVDGAVIGQMGVPDMRLPIQYALTYPARKPMQNNTLDLTQISQLTFEKPDLEAMAGLRLAFEAMEEGGNIPTVYNAANERAVQYFLDRKIGFLQITDFIKEAMDNADYIGQPTLEDILETEEETHEFLESLLP